MVQLRFFRLVKVSADIHPTSSFRIYPIVEVLPRCPGSISSSRFHLHFVPSQPCSISLYRFYLYLLAQWPRSISTFVSRFNLSILSMPLVFILIYLFIQILVELYFIGQGLASHTGFISTFYLLNQVNPPHSGFISSSRFYLITWIQSPYPYPTEHELFKFSPLLHSTSSSAVFNEQVQPYFSGLT